ncbi:hypothetical protein BDV19DRAFT_367273 [Aspergillus venezuelensis]
MSSPPFSQDNSAQPHHQYSAASTTAIPTIQTLKNPKRSVSYNTQDSSPPISPDDIHNPHNHQHTSPTNKKLDPAAATKMMKASLTGFLNSSEAKAEVPKRKLQNMLMNTERDSRQARRASLSENGHGHRHGHRHSRSNGSGNGTRALLDPMESIRRSDAHYNGLG